MRPSSLRALSFAFCLSGHSIRPEGPTGKQDAPGKTAPLIA
ncbi:hypothetical protein roselon_02405 [Roseibacterium elongatum DSM 19469]|uniref:Uncharacterized protein n=1 Tax=Roseicyclus elongatus DSM 19469 TaxID=1294273 RepID=W8S3E3_9RHOB|nr:hypothetical protein roselon_02405 [Roseibacterium elongatum DSM 19469]